MGTDDQETDPDDVQETDSGVIEDTDSEGDVSRDDVSSDEWTGDVSSDEWTGDVSSDEWTGDVSSDEWTGDVSSDEWSGDVSSDERTWAILVHASAFIGMMVPMGHIVAPLLIWLIKREESEFVDANGKEAVNFQLSMTIYVAVAAILVILLIGIFLLPLLVLAWFALVILASIRASEDQVYRYPATIRFFS